MKNKTKSWEIFWEIPDCPPFLTSEPARFFTTQMKNFCGKNFSDCILEYKDNVNIWYLDGKEWSELDANLFKGIEEDVVWGQNINKISEKYCFPCLDYIESIIGKNYSILSDQELYFEYEKFMDIYVPAHYSGHPANVLEMKNQRLSRYLKTYIMNRLMAVSKKGNADEVFSILTEPVQDMSNQKEAISFYKLAYKISQNFEAFKLIRDYDNKEDTVKFLESKFSEYYKDIYEHYISFCWTPYNWEGPSNDLGYYLGTLSSLFKQKVDLKSELLDLENRSQDVEKRQKKIVDDLAIDSKHLSLFKIASDIMFMKSVRKDCMYKGAWATEPMYKEIGKRIGLDTHQSRFIFRFEMKKILVDKSIDVSIIKQRTKRVVLYQREDKEDVVLSGNDADAFIKNLDVKEPDRNIKNIKGQIAYPGKVTGVVKYINTPEMMDKMNDGDILIAYATQPNLLPAMRKAAAFVTDFGGITCHAAIVAREWNVPCIIGTKIATKVLKDGDLVEVDANTGVVRIIKKA